MDIALRLAVQKFGRTLKRDGTREFQEAVARAAAESGLRVAFTDQTLNALVTERRAAISTARAHAEALGRLEGELVAHGAAAYRFAPGSGPSYYVTLRDARGEAHTVWGVDLERSLRAAGVGLGERIRVQRAGWQAVTVRDEDGRTVPAERARWHTERLGEAQGPAAPAPERQRRCGRDDDLSR